MSLHRLLCKVGAHHFPYPWRENLRDETRQIRICSVCGLTQDRPLSMGRPIPLANSFSPNIGGNYEMPTYPRPKTMTPTENP